MKLAIMQPYLFPYLGYFQLIGAVDAFVFYDDVSFRKQGWVNRNRILVNGAAVYFTLPLRCPSSFVPIRETLVSRSELPRWRSRFMRTLTEAYATSSHRSAVVALVAAALDVEESTVGAIAERSVRLCCDHLGIRTRLLRSSRDFPASGATGAERVLEICAAAGASEYVNAPGGRALYDPDRFDERGVALKFLVPRLEPYPQPADAFVPGLSIIDVLMRQDREAASRSAALGTFK